MSAPLWRPRELVSVETGRTRFVTPAPLPSDRYITIDERVEGVVGLVIAEWPTVTPQGTLRFPGKLVMAWFEAPELHAVIEPFRRKAKQVERPLRIGDTFWVRDWNPNPKRWGRLLDITQGARQAAKVAVAVAIGDYGDLVQRSAGSTKTRPKVTPPVAGPESVAQPLI